MNLTITLFGQTRTIEVRQMSDTRLDSGFATFVAKTKTGTKRHSASVTFWAVEGPGRNVGQTEDGRYWKANLDAVILNKRGSVVGWNDDSVTSRHSGEWFA